MLDKYYQFNYVIQIYKNSIMHKQHDTPLMLVQ